VANTLQNHFVSIVGQDSEPLGVHEQNRPSFNNSADSCFFSPIDESEMRKSIAQINTGKSPGEDTIPARLIKDNINYFAPLLTELFNKIISEGVYPSNEKIAKIIPLFKKGDKSNAANYRPISLLNICNKIFERLIFDQIDDYLQKHNLYDEEQFGFRRSRGCAEALASLSHKISEIVDKNNTAVLISFDIEKAFDSVDHKILCNKLELLGIRGHANNIIKSYLSNRSQFVQYKNAKSSKAWIKRGVPQGSCLAPLLFNIFLMDMKLLSTKSKLIKFADDLVLIFEYDNKVTDDSNCSFMLHDLTLLDDFYRSCALKLNHLKSNFIIIGKNINDSNLLTILQDKNLQRKDSIVYLGVTLDSSFSFEDHAQNLISKLTKATNALRVLKKNGVSNQMLLNFYFGHFHSHVSYCAFLLMRVSCNTLLRLQRLQNRILKIIFDLPILTPTEALFSDYAQNVLPVLGIVFTSSLSILNKALTLKDCSLPTPAYYNTKRKTFIKPLLYKKDIRRFDVFCFGAKLFNQLDETTKKTTSFALFKQRVVKYLKANKTRLLKSNDIKNFNLAQA
jgi:retron-type reverse transcriptase